MTGIARVFALAALCATMAIAAPLKKPAPKPWHAGDYHHIVAGKTTKADVIKALGNPDETRAPILTVFATEQCCEEVVYHGKSESHGDLAIAVRKNGAVVYVLDQFPRATPRTAAYKQYGQDWRERAYSSADCAAKNGVAPLYVDPAGLVTLIEYPQKGIALYPASGSVDFFGAVYLATAPGGAKPACVK